jgi:3-oxoacyl-[acyl-carrier-protein] synthase-3
MEEASLKALNVNGLSPSDISLLIPHQANRRIIDATAKRLGVGSDRLFTNLHRYGNTSSASIPIALDEANRQGIAKADSKLLLVAFGGGFAYGSALINW